MGDHLIGQASAEVVLAGLGPATLPLEPCNLAFGKIAWDPAAADAAVALPHPKGAGSTTATPTSVASKPSTPFLFGLGADGKLQAIVDRSGRLRFDWSLAGHRDAADMLGFLFEIPSAPANELSLELPEGFTPGVRRGVVVGSEPAGQADAPLAHRTGRPPSLPRPHPAGRLVRTASATGLVATSDNLRLFAPRPGSLVPLETRGPQPTAAPGDGAFGSRAGIGFRPIRRRIAPLVGRAVGRRAGHPGRVGPSRADPRRRASAAPQRRRPLGPRSPLAAAANPRRRPLLAGRNRHALDAGAALDQPNRADRLRADGDRTALGARAGESLQFQAFQPDATVELSLARRPATLQVLSATAIDLGTEEVTARVAADFRLTEGARLAIAADVAQHWTIDAVESTPPEAVADWSLDSQPGGGQRLAIRLATGLSPIKPLRLAITARRLVVERNRGLRIDDLLPVRFGNAADGKQLIAVRPAATYALKLSGAERLKQLGADDLNPAELALLAGPPQDLLFEYDARASRLEIALVPQRAKYAGTIQIDAALEDGLLRESCRLRCVPESGRVDRLLVQFFPRRDTASPLVPRRRRPRAAIRAEVVPGGTGGGRIQRGPGDVGAGTSPAEKCPLRNHGRP